ncbi:ATPase [Acetobacter sp. AN02]|uniref:BadF/BadG/BcrA/BcrD ATPase family protein n=1 Tax=Acetobacter sp. AN02 TaxID=2894186 RepID=UPI00243411D7|nr:BadF/BadG/BcrA/BcrD ATPase family protein [Acetobacter sp. AN02]MDG6093663.1 ATPase [Acetobacter sp. AN02]
MTGLLRVAIDGGGTKTLLRLATQDGTILAETTGGPSNIATDAQRALHSIRSALDEALHNSGLSSTRHPPLLAGAGLAGAEIPEARARFLALPHGFDHLVLTSDARTSCLGAHDGQDGAILAVGTGSVGFACLGDETRRTGGWGFPHDDAGSGAWIGRKATAIMLRAEDGRSPPSALSRALRTWISQNSTASVTAWPAGLTAERAAGLVPLVFREADQGCPVAENLLRHAASETELLGRTLLQDSFASLPVSLCGSLGERLKSRSSWLTEFCVPARGNALDGAMSLTAGIAFPEN